MSITRCEWVRLFISWQVQSAYSSVRSRCWEITAVAIVLNDVKSVPRVLLWPTSFAHTEVLPVECSIVDWGRVAVLAPFVTNTTVYNGSIYKYNLIDVYKYNLIDVYKYNLIDACINVFLESLERKFMLAIFIYAWKFGVTLWVCYSEGQHNGQVDWPSLTRKRVKLTPLEDLELVTH